MCGVRCQKTSPWCTLGTGNSPPNGGDRVGEAVACSELLDEAEGPEMGSKGGRLCADTWPAPPRVEEGQGQSSSSNVLEAPAPPKIATAARGRGKRSKRPAATARCEPAELVAAESGALRSAALSDSSVMEVSDGEALKSERGSETLRQVVREGLRQVAGKKSQAAGAAQLKSVETEIMAAVFNVCRVPSAGKLHQGLAEMQRELARLSASNAALEAELRLTKAELAVCRSQPHPSAEPDLLGLMRREMAAFRQRFDVLESRLLRPPLAASRSSTSTSYAAVAAGPPTTTPPAVQAPATTEANALAGRSRRRRGAVTQQAEGATATGEPTPPARAANSSEWQVVGEARKVAKEARKRRKKAQRQRRQQQRKEKRAAALLLAPKTAAVVITLQPDAVKRGVTYGDVLAKVTATGARLLEVPGAASGSSADALTERLRTCLGADEARVSRPIKCLDLRILGLDDSATEYEVVAAVARTGGCPV
ncbi:hypothetical protein SFRURICE_008186 [Spodoptera frugiperda]|nr:hypothetical protein SFRURICE_008186 [Spodoptera frugiperda]